MRSSTMTDSAVLLEARDISRRHPNGRDWLLEGVSLEVRAGDRLAVVGESGSGKTLLLRALVLLDPFDAGQVLARGTPIDHDGVPSFRREVIYLHQRPTLWDETVMASLEQPFELAVYREQSFDRPWAIDRLADLGRDEAFLDKLVADLSGGERQLVALLRALQLGPSILLLDEPTAALDAAAARAVEQLLGRWLAESPDTRALVVVSHDAEQARRLSDRLLQIEAGRLIGENAG